MEHIKPGRTQITENDARKLNELYESWCYWSTKSARAYVWQEQRDFKIEAEKFMVQYKNHCRDIIERTVV